MIEKLGWAALSVAFITLNIYIHQCNVSVVEWITVSFLTVIIVTANHQQMFTVAAAGVVTKQEMVLLETVVVQEWR